VFLLLFIIAVEAGYLWLSRVELENALEAAALAAVKEWGDANGGSTLVPRQIGVEYAAANTINGVPVAIDMNYNPANTPNENDSCAGDLVFGAITNEDYQCGDPVVFNAGIQPSCGGLGWVVFDVNGQGEGSLANDNAWGIAFLRTDDTPANLTIQSVTFNLRANDPDAYFDFTSAGPVLSNSLPAPVIAPQLDVWGFSNPGPGPGTQIQFSPTSGTSPTLTITFGPDLGPGGDLGFEPCDRIRFGALVDQLGPPPGWAHDDADAIGYYAVQVTIVFALGGVPRPPVTTNFWHTNDITCSPPYIDTTDTFICDPEHYIVHPTAIPDIPCPQSGPPGNPYNNGQSYVWTSGGGEYPFAVRAQKTIEVPGLICWLCSLPIGPFNVSACSTAMYDCNDLRPRLVRVEEFICPGP
jgi:hypothetical protein